MPKYRIEIETTRREATVIGWRSKIPYEACEIRLTGVEVSGEIVDILESDINSDYIRETNIEFFIAGEIVVDISDESAEELGANGVISFLFEFYCPSVKDYVANYDVWVNTPARIVAIEKVE